jgi:RND family efflux transporter MFP subunit
MKRSAAALAAAALLLAGAGATYFLMRDTRPEVRPATTAPDANRQAPAAAPLPAPATPIASGAPLRDVVVPLSQEAVARAGIVTTPVAAGALASELRLPGVVEPNAYKQVLVTPLVAGRITQVGVALGDRVRRGQALAQIYSPQLAEAQTRYVAARAMLDAHDRELQRTQKLVDIGAASRQELERIHAEHAAQTAALESARSQLELLGVASAAIDRLTAGHSVSATTTVPAPIDGVVTERGANAGLNVDPATKLFTVVDLSTVWVVANAYERDFSRVRAGSEAIVTTPAYPDLKLRGKVSYIDPQMNADTRTARLRVEVANPRGELRLGMFVDVVVAGAPGVATLTIPRSAVQDVGDRAVVYLVNPKEPGRFIEREVRLGQVSGDDIAVTSGVQPGDVVVTQGSFFVRAERERLGLRSNERVETARIELTEQGYEPSKVTVRAGAPARITFVRMTDNTCGTEITFPSLNIRRPLPLKQPVDIEFTPAKSGDIAFVCGMGMLKGVVVVQ